MEKRNKILELRKADAEARRTVRIADLHCFFKRNPVVRMWAEDLKENFGTESNIVKVASFGDSETK